jgi:hypothetical protein
MEDILASIRRIIADDDAAVPPPKAPDSPIPSFVSPRTGEARSALPPPAAPASSRTGQTLTAPAELPPIEEKIASNDLEPAKSADAIAKTGNDVLELTQPTAPPTAQKTDKATRPDKPEMVLSQPSEDAPEFSPARTELQRPLLSTATTTAVNSAFNVLAQTVLMQNARTLDDLVKEMLRPLLKSWLDDNLPGLVERLVRAEIERVSRGRS